MGQAQYCSVLELQHEFFAALARQLRCSDNLADVPPN
jgi:hypothetical protein